MSQEIAECSSCSKYLFDSTVASLPENHQPKEGKKYKAI